MKDSTCFIDTNIWLYSLIEPKNVEDKKESIVADEFLDTWSGKIFVSSQVVNEVLKNMIQMKGAGTVKTFSYLIAFCLVSSLLSCTAQTVTNTRKKVYESVPAMETQAVETAGDICDDPCIFIHPVDTNLSTIIGTDKDDNRGGLRVYDLDGREIQFIQDGKMNNVDIRYDFPLGKEKIALVTAGNRSKDTVAIYKVDLKTRKLINVEARCLPLKIKVYGSCMYRSPRTGKYFAFVNDKRGKVVQWELYDNQEGKVDGKFVRTFSVNSQTEGCVADDDLGFLYLGEENTGIWKFSAEPEGGPQRKLVDKVGAHLVADVEGLTIYKASDKTGYLIASSQGDNTYAVYEREGSNKYIGSFAVVEGNGIDGTSETDGIDVTHYALGDRFPLGIFVAQDGLNNGENQNFKCVRWDSIAKKFDPPLKINVGK